MNRGEQRCAAGLRGSARGRSPTLDGQRRPPGTSRLGWSLAALTLPLAIAGCTSLSFGLANLPTHASHIQRMADVAYGPGARQRLDIYRPATASAMAKPVIVFWYGGGWMSGSRTEYRFVGVALAQLGYVTMLADYRLYPQARFPLFLDDGAQAVAWVQRHAAEYGGDPRRIVLMGHSAGAHMAAMLALNRRFLEQAGADAGGIVGLIGLSGPYDLTPNTATLHAIFHAPFTPHDWQVLPYVSAQAPPALLLHGSRDTLVDAAATGKLATALRAQGVRVETRIYDGRGHVDTLAALSVLGRGRAPALQDIAVFMHSLEEPASAAPAAGGSSRAIAPPLLPPLMSSAAQPAADLSCVVFTLFTP
jgi:acetyl esterase/lipase